MHVVVNVVKTVGAVSMGIPCHGGYWNSRRRLAVMLKFSMDNLVISGLGDLVCFIYLFIVIDTYVLLGCPTLRAPCVLQQVENDAWM